MKLPIGRSKMRVFIMLALTVVLLAIPVVVHADQGTVDNDVASPGNQNIITLNAAPAATVKTSGQIVVEHKGSKHLLANTPITFSGASSGTNLPAGYIVDSITLTVPNPWNTDGQIFNGISNISFTAPSTPGLYVYTVKWDASNFTCGSTGCITATGALTINLTVTSPADTTPPSVGYTLNPASPDGANGWYKSNVTLVWSVTDPESAVTKSGCVDQNITADQAATTYSCSAKSAGGSAGPVSVTIQRDATAPSAPTATVSPAPNGLGWSNTNVTVSFTGNGDNGPSGLAGCTPATNLTNETTGISVSGTCTDNAGNTSPVASVNVKIDKTAPTISASAKKADNTPYAAGTWTNQTVTVHFNCDDTGGSGVASCPADATYGTDGKFSAGGTVTDNAGNSASTSFSLIQVDKTPPSITFVNRTPANGYGWNNGDVTVNWSCTDSLSGVVAATASKTVATEGASQSATGICTDNAGNSASNTQTGINIDKTAPSLNPSVSPNPVLLNGSATASPNVTDALSGVASSSCDPVVTSTVGPHSVSCTATDKAGNVGNGTANYNVAYAFVGLLPPYAPPAQKLFKSGSTFPIKWQYADANGVIQNSAAANPATPIIYTAVCTSSSSPLDPVDDAGSSGLRYDSTTNMWIYDWKTPAYSSMCYDISIKSQQSGQIDGPFPFGTK